MSAALKAEMKRIEEMVNGRMSGILPSEVEGRIGENRLVKAMRYSALAQGKRIRPFLVMTTAKLFGVSEQCSSQVAAAIEYVHAFSLIHDDLPALDNDDFRRGQPSLHKKFDEATAILAGDALLNFAYEVLAHETTHSDPQVRLELVTAFSKAIGYEGMIGGQMLDMISEEKELTVDQITRLQRQKTGMLFAVACEAGAILGKAPQNVRNALRGYANNVGLVFQITDDLLDVLAESNPDGSERKDKSAGKGTYVSVMGIEKSKTQAQLLTNQAIEYLNVFGKNAEMLSELAKFIVSRTA